MTTTDIRAIDRGRSEAFHMSADSTYVLPAAQAVVFANEDSPVFLGGTREESR